MKIVHSRCYLRPLPFAVKNLHQKMPYGEICTVALNLHDFSRLNFLLNKSQPVGATKQALIGALCSNIRLMQEPSDPGRLDFQTEKNRYYT